MAHIEDRWTKPGPSGRRVKSERHGTGKRWLAVWEEDGRRRKKAFTVRDAAATHLLNLESRVPLGRALFAECADGWLAGQTQLSPASRSRRARQVETVKAAFAGLTVGEVTRPVIQAAVNTWGDRFVPTSVRDLLMITRGILRTAVADGLLAVTPGGVNRPKVKRRVVWPLTLPEVLAMEQQIPAYYRVLVPLGAATGMRISEMLGLTVDRINLTGDGAVITVARQGDHGAFRELKGDAAPRKVPIDRETVRRLKEHMASYPTSGLLVQSLRGGMLPMSTVQKAWGTGRKNLGWPAHRKAWHELRHFHASILIRSGMSPRDVADRLGHADPALTLRVYSHLWEGDEDRAVAALEAMWGSPTLRVVEPPQDPQRGIAAGG